MESVTLVKANQGAPQCTATWPGALPVAAFEYGYDDRGNRAVQRYAYRLLESESMNPVERTEYAYDEADRLVGVKYGEEPSDAPSGAPTTATLYKLGGDGTRLGEKDYTEYGGALASGEYDSGSVSGR
jgi:hypothetical protein